MPALERLVVLLDQAQSPLMLAEEEARWLLCTFLRCNRIGRDRHCPGSSIILQHDIGDENGDIQTARVCDGEAERSGWLRGQSEAAPSHCGM